MYRAHATPWYRRPGVPFHHKRYKSWLGIELYQTHEMEFELFGQDM